MLVSRCPSITCLQPLTSLFAAANLLRCLPFSCRYLPKWPLSTTRLAVLVRFTALVSQHSSTTTDHDTGSVSYRSGVASCTKQLGRQQLVHILSEPAACVSPIAAT